MTMIRRYAEIGGVKVRLAAWLPSDQRYQDRLIPVDPNLQFLPNDRSTLLARQASTFWQMNEWKAGEGFDRWKPDREGGGYHRSDGVRPRKVGDGLVLSFTPEVTKDSTLITDFAEGGALGLAQGKLWSCRNGTAHSWDPSGGNWSTGITTGATTNVCVSIADGQDTWVYSGHGDLKIYRWKTGTSQTHYGTGTGDDFTYAPLLCSFGGRLFALDGDDLYEIDLTAANTRTLVADVTGKSSEYLGFDAAEYRRLSVSDKGPIWIQRLDNGQTLLWEYNVAQDVAYIVGELPVGFAIPTSIFHARGFLFVGFVEAGEPGVGTIDGYIYFQRGTQRGVLGPVRRYTGNGDPGELAICGTLGDELMFYFDQAIWAYNLTDGGLYHIAGVESSAVVGATMWGAVVGQDVFVSRFSGGEVERYRADRYAASGTSESGLYDMGYLDIPKKLVEVTVVTEPLPAGTSVSAAYTVDGTNYTALTGAHDTDGASEKTWVVSTSAGTTVRGRRFGIRLTLATSDPTVTPTVRGVLVRARSAAHERQIVMQVDVSTGVSDVQATADLIASLRGLVTAQDVVSFASPLLGDPEDSPETFDVEVRNLVVPDAENPADRLAAVVELAAVELVVA